MSHLSAQYEELLALTKLYLLQTYEEIGWAHANPDHFKDLANFIYSKEKPQVFEPQTQAQPLYPKEKSKPVASLTVEAKLESKTLEPVEEHAVPAKPASIAEEKFKTNLEAATYVNKPFLLEPYKQSPVTDFDDIRQVLKEKFPHKEILDDFPIKAKTGITLTAYSAIVLEPNQNKYYHFLQSINKALNLYFSSSILLYVNRFNTADEWKTFLDKSQLKWVLVPKKFLPLLPFQDLQKGENFYTLWNTHVILLEDENVYFNNPSAKLDLWNALSTLLKPS